MAVLSSSPDSGFTCERDCESQTRSVPIGTEMIPNVDVLDDVNVDLNLDIESIATGSDTGSDDDGELDFEDDSFLLP